MIYCPRAMSMNSPCVARDGHQALDDGNDFPRRPRQCVGCGSDPRDLIRDLGQRYAPARRYRQTYDRARCADQLVQLVAAYVVDKEIGKVNGEAPSF